MSPFVAFAGLEFLPRDQGWMSYTETHGSPTLPTALQGHLAFPSWGIASRMPSPAGDSHGNKQTARTRGFPGLPHTGVAGAGTLHPSLVPSSSLPTPLPPPLPRLPPRGPARAPTRRMRRPPSVFL